MRQALGLTLMVVGLGGGLFWLLNGLLGLEASARISTTRTPLPGERTLSLDAGKHVVFYEALADSTTYDDITVPTVRVALAPVRRPALRLDDYSATFEVQGDDGRTASAIHTVQVPRRGAYTLSASGGGRHPDEAVVLGRPTAPRVVRTLAVAIPLLVVCGAGGALFAFARSGPRSPGAVRHRGR